VIRGPAVQPRVTSPLWMWALPLVGLVVGVAFGALGMAARYAAEPIDASGLVAYGAFFGAAFGLAVGVMGSFGAYLAGRFASTAARDTGLRIASGAGCGVAVGWLLLLVQSAASTGSALDAASLVLALLSTAGAFLGVWLTEGRRVAIEGPPS
jgi:hypothetical protein